MTVSGVGQIGHAGHKDIAGLGGAADREATGCDASEVRAVVHVRHTRGVHIPEFNGLRHGVGCDRKGPRPGIDAGAVGVERIGKEADVPIRGGHRRGGIQGNRRGIYRDARAAGGVRHRVIELHGPPGAGDGGGLIHRDGIAVGLIAGGRDAAAVEGGGAARIGRERGQAG